MNMKKDFIAGYRLLFGYLGIFIALVGVILLLPLVVLPFYPSEANVAYMFIIPGSISLLTGVVLAGLLLRKKEKGNLEKHQDSTLLVLIWIFAIVIGSIPFMIRGDMSITESIFESCSGFTATGFTTFDFSTSLGFHVFTLYRSLLLFFGGIGLVLIVSSAISDRYGMRLYYAEGHNDKLMPNLVKSARVILSLYVGFIAFGSIAYTLSGMPIFDAINHSIACVATGGFSTKANSIGFYNSVPIDIISMVLMVLGGTNFVLHLMLLQRKFGQVIKDIEIRFFFIVIAIFVPLMVVNIAMLSTSYDWWNALRYGLFEMISAITTTGMTNTPVGFVFPSGVILMATVLMLIGAGMGSTGGAIKQYRVAVTIKGIYWNIRDKMSSKRLLRPHLITRYGVTREISKEEYQENSSYFILYLLVFLGGTLALTMFPNVSIGDAAFEFSSALSGTGLSIGNINLYAFEGEFYILMVGMFLGRLEIIAVYHSIFRLTRDIIRKDIV